MANMSDKVRLCILAIAKSQSFFAKIENEGGDHYEKNLMFQSPNFKSAVFIDKVTGVDKASGDFSYLKVAVHPSSFKTELINPAFGVEDYISSQSKVNRHHSSNYRGGNFPNDIPGESSRTESATRY
jgi:hypothetical protein